MVRRTAVLVVASLLASLGVLVGGEVAAPPAPVVAQTLPPAGLSTLAGSGTAGQADGVGTAASFDRLLDVAVSPAGDYLYALDQGTGGGRPNAIRKISTTTGAVTTLATGGRLASAPTDIEVDAAGNPWVSLTLAPGEKGIVKFDQSGAETVMLSGLCCSYFGTEFVGDAFLIDSAGGYLYYSAAQAPQAPEGDAKKFAWVWRIPLGSLPAAATGGTAIDEHGPIVRGPVADMAMNAAGQLHVVWRDAGKPGCCYTTALVRLDGSTFSYVDEDFGGHPAIAFAGRSSSLYAVCSGCDTFVRRSGGGAGPDETIAGSTGGFADGDPGQMNGPSGLAMAADGSMAWIADQGNRRIRRVLVPPDPGELSASALCGSCNPGMKRLQSPDVADPVDVATGNLTESFTDLVVPGRGREVSASRTYNSYFAAVGGLFGPGWSSPLDTRLTATAGVVWIRQENGSEISFWRGAGNVMTSPPWVTSTLQKITGGWRLDRNHGDIVTFDDDGRVTGWEDRNGYVTTVTRPTASQIVVTTPGGRSLTFTVSGGHVTSVSDDSSPVRTVDYTYTGGRLTKVESFKVNATDTGRVTWQYRYDARGRLDQVTDPRGNSNYTHYDGRNRVDYQLDYAGARTDIAYGGTYPNEWRNVTHPAHTAAGTRSVTRYQLSGLLTASITTGHGTTSARTTSFTYDPDTLGLATITGPGSVPLGSFTYDANGNVLTSTDATGRTTTFAYADPANPNSPTSSTDPAGNVTTFTYDDAGNPETTSTPVRLPNGTLQGTAVTTFERTDSAHPEDVTAIVDPDQQGQPTPKKTRLSYRPGDGQLSWIEDPEGNRTTFGYDSRGFVTSTVTPRGNASATAGDYETTFAVNDFGMVRSITDPLGEVSSQLYDGNGNVVSVTDANSQTTTTTYDAMGRSRVVTRPDSSQTETTYFPNGAVRAQVNGLGDDTTYTYDVHGSLASATQPDGQSTGYRYDSLGRLQYRIDPGGTCPGTTGCTTYGYSATTRELTSVAYSDPATPDITAIGYDTLGRRTSLTRSSGPAQSWAWDSLARLRSGTDVNGRTTAYGWTLGGNLASITYPGQSAPVTYAYDAADRMTSVTDWAGRQTQIGWTADSQWQTTTFPTGTTNVDTRTYDEAGRLATVEWKRGATSLGQLTYDRDPEGLLESETPTGGTFSTKTWGYDDLDQLDQVDTTSLTLDDAGNLTRTEDGTYQTFDPAQQICWTSPTATGGTCTTTAPADATTYDYDSRGNRTAMARPDATAATYGYDQENRMVSVRDGTERPLSEQGGAPTAGDFDGDDIDDIFWTTPNTVDDVMSWGSATRGAIGRESSTFDFDFPHTRLVADFDGDGSDDVFHYGWDAITDEAWFHFGRDDGDHTTRSFSVNGLYRPVAGDFDGDGFGDIYWYGPGTGADHIWWGNANVDTSAAFTSQAVNRGGDFLPVVGDLDNNGYDDIVWYTPGTGADDVYFAAGGRNSWLSRPITVTGSYELATGDVDGDNRDDLLFVPAGGGGTVWWGAGANTFGSAAQKALTLPAGAEVAVGDFDGDGTDDAFVDRGTGADTAWWGSSRTAFGTDPAEIGLPTDPRTATYAYSADGLRSAKTVDGATTQFTWDTSRGLPLLLSQHQGATATQIVYGPSGTPLYEVTGSAVTYYHQDHQGSTRLTTNSSGTAVARYAYGAYGELTTNTAPASAEPILGYTGQYTDAETGFVYLRARYMDPTTGQFTSRDPISSSTRQPYSYAGGNPVALTDPFGLCGWTDPMGCVEEAAEEVVDTGRDVVREGAEIIRAGKNSTATAAGYVYNEAQGRDCEYQLSDHTVLCYGDGRPITIGNTIFTGGTRAEWQADPDLQRHELAHTTQWAIFGWSYPQAYGLASLFSKGICDALGQQRESEEAYACYNVFEMWAGLKDGDYDC